MRENGRKINLKGYDKNMEKAIREKKMYIDL